MRIYDVFLSYRRSDGKAVAEAVYQYLTQKGLRVFFDTEEMLDGQYFTTQIENNLRKAPNYVLIASKDALAFREGEDWVHKEIAIALAEHRKNPSQRSFTVLMLPGAAFPAKETMPEDVREVLDMQQTSMQDEWKGREKITWEDKILTSVTGVNRCNLWHSAHRWWESSCGERGRFANLHIVEGLLSHTTQTRGTDFPILVQLGSQTQPQMPLLEALGANKDHGYLIGEGGVGKTTALMYIMNQAYANKVYDPHCQIPLFIDLSYAPDTDGKLYENGESSFIRRSVYCQLREDRSFKQVSARNVSQIDEVFGMDYNVAVQPINTVFGQNTDAPEYLLLLDGLNEVSTVRLEKARKSVRQMILGEIRELMENFPNVRVLLTSRFDYEQFYDRNLVRYYLSGLQPETVVAYLGEQGFIPENQDLMNILRIPLFLTMYVTLKDKAQVNTRSEILKIFLNDHLEGDYLYTESTRWERVEKNVSSAASKQQHKRITAPIVHFIFDFILPELAWQMDRREQFSLPIYEIRQIITSLLTDRSDLSVCGKFSTVAFPQYNKPSVKQTPETVAQEIQNQFTEDNISDEILEFCSLALGVLRPTNNGYGFVHQHIRDYFAAVKHTNQMRLALAMPVSEKQLAQECLDQVLAKQPVSMVVRQYIGELLGEHYNRPQMVNGNYKYHVPPDRNVIDRCLLLYKGRFCEQQNYGVYNLVNILKEVRGTLAGAKLSELDLTKCNLNGVQLTLKRMAADLFGSKLHGENLFLQGHTGNITAVAFSPDENSILSVAGDGEVKLWDVASGALQYTFVLDKPAFFAGFVRGGRRILIVSQKPGNLFTAPDVFVSLWDAQSFRHLDEKHFAVPTSSVILSPDGNYLLLSNRNQCTLISTRKLEIICDHKPENFGIQSCNFLDDETVLICISNKEGRCKVERLDIAGVETWDCTKRIHRLACHPLRNEAVLVVTAGVAESQCLIVDTQTGAQLAELHLPENSRVKRIAYSSDGNWLCIAAPDIHLYNTRDYTLERSFPDGGGTFAFDASCRRLLMAGIAGNVLMYSTDRFERQLVISGTSSQRPMAAFSPDGAQIVTASEENVLRLWDTATATVIAQVTVPGSRITELRFLSDGIYVSSYGFQGIYDPVGLQQKHRLSQERHFAQDGKWYYIWKSDMLQVYNQEDRHIFTADSAEQVEICNDRILIRDADDLWTVYDLNNGALCWTGDHLRVVLGQNHVAALSEAGLLEIYPLNHPLAKLGFSFTFEGQSGIPGFSQDDHRLVQVDKDSVTIRQGDNFEILLTKHLSDIRRWDVLGQYLVISHSQADKGVISVFHLDTMEMCLQVEDPQKDRWYAPVLDGKAEKLLIPASERNAIYLFCGTDTKLLVLASGLDVANLDLEDLHEDSRFTQQQKTVLRQYGAIIS